jgi:hypothetical protein
MTAAARALIVSSVGCERFAATGNLIHALARSIYQGSGRVPSRNTPP